MTGITDNLKNGKLLTDNFKSRAHLKKTLKHLGGVGVKGRLELFRNASVLEAASVP